MRFLVITVMAFLFTRTIGYAETYKTMIAKGDRSHTIWEDKGSASSDYVKILIKNTGDGAVVAQPVNTVIPGRSGFLLLVKRGNVAIDDASGPGGNGTELEYDVITEDFSMSYGVRISSGAADQKVFEMADGNLSPSARFSITHVGGSGTVKVRPRNAELAPNSRPLELAVETRNIVLDSVTGDSQVTVRATILEALH